jgi:hypothetical protein
MKKYIGVKMVEAEPMSRFDYCESRGWNVPLDESPMDDGYLIKYPDGYVSWSPKDVFEEAYRETDGMTFGLAIEALKKGHRVAREGWNGKNMDVCMRMLFDSDGMAINNIGLVLHNVGGKRNTWVPSITDVLAEDWVIVK